MENYENYEVESNEVTESNDQVIDYDQYRYESKSIVGKLAAATGAGVGIGVLGYLAFDKWIIPGFKNLKAAAERKKLVEQAKKEIIAEQIAKKQQEVQDADYREVKKEEEPKKKK